MAQANKLPGVADATDKHSGAVGSKPFFSSENSFFWLLPGIGLMLLYALFPLLYNLWISFREWDLMGKEFDPVYGEGLPFFGENWKTIWDSTIAGPLNINSLLSNGELTNNLALALDPRLQNSLVITFQYVLIALTFQLVLGFIIALLLDADPWGKGLMQSLMILPMVIAPAIAGMIFRLLLHSELGGVQWMLYQVGITSQAEPLMGGSGQYALAALLIVDIWQWTPFFVIILLAGLKGLPQEVMEAASVDGANFFQRLFRIKIPLLRGVLLIAVLFRLIDLYRVYDYVHIMTSGGPAGATETISYYNAIQTFNQLEWGYGAAISVTILLIAWLSALIYQRAFRISW